MRGTGGRGKPGRMGAGANLSEAGTARGFHKRKSMRKGEGRYGGYPTLPYPAPRRLAVFWLFALSRAHAGPRAGQHDAHLVLAPGTWHPVNRLVSCLAWLTVRCPRRR